mmetsp:Transcript_36789/g.88690  ORF Transcript_36789/g.88690 Transcript_36789/m.88690 type:complete len:250 (+) Transcript_36789:281-1030(+)
MKPIQLMTSLFSIGWLSLVLPSCAFTPVSRPVNAQPLTSLKAIPTVEMPAAGAKSSFLNSLDPTIGLITPGSKPLTQQLTNIIESGNSLPNPGSQESFSKVANGVWRVVYAPHMTTMAGLARGKFSVEYELFEDGTIISHARYNFPLFNLYGYLSVSGTYGSVNDQVCRVDFNEAWIKQLGDGHSFEEGPYATIDSVPDSISKSIIRNAGRAAFIEPFAVFPVSYLDEDLIVFDFELLGTRICARRYHS